MIDLCGRNVVDQVRELIAALRKQRAYDSSDGLAVCRRFPDLAAAGKMAVRLDTHGGRFLDLFHLGCRAAVVDMRIERLADREGIAVHVRFGIAALDR